MSRQTKLSQRKYEVFSGKDLATMPQLGRLDTQYRRDMQAVAAVLPFRVNAYVTDELIDWSRVPDDPMFRLTFPQPGMLAKPDLRRMRAALAAGPTETEKVAWAIRRSLNPHPAGQMEFNVPRLGPESLPGIQHKYRDTVLFFPQPGQTCHAYCTYCFRWPQFVGMDELKFAARQADTLVAYLKVHPEVSNVLLTGGDPLIMGSKVLRRFVEPLLTDELAHITVIRIGTKSVAYWPHRFVTDDDADDLLRLFEQVKSADRHLALMAHYSHPVELSTPVAQAAVRRIQSTGAVIRCQAPLIRYINDAANVWAELWRAEVRLGAVPYYMFVERDTGPRGYFEVPLARCFEIFQKAYRRVSGLERTVRGPSMSTLPGKVIIDGVSMIAGERVFNLRFVQAREPDWVRRPFYARYDEKATWLDQLKPAFGEREFFFEPSIRRMRQDRRALAYGHRPAPRRELTIFGSVEWE